MHDTREMVSFSCANLLLDFDHWLHPNNILKRTTTPKPNVALVYATYMDDTETPWVNEVGMNVSQNTPKNRRHTQIDWFVVSWRSA